MADVKVIALGAQTRLKKWKNRSQKGMESVEDFMKEGEDFKRKKYKEIAIKEGAVNPTEQDPLEFMGVRLTPFVVSQWGNLGQEALKLLKEMADYKVSRRIELDGVNSDRKQYSELMRKWMQWRELGRMKALMAAAIGKAMAGSYSKEQQGLNVLHPSREQRQGRAGGIGKTTRRGLDH